MGTCENWHFCETWSLYEGVKELWLFTSVNTKAGDCSLSVTGARSRAAHSLGPGETRPGTTSGLWHRNVAALGGFMSPALCLSCSLWEVAEIPPVLVWAPAGAQLQLEWHLCCQNPLIAWTHILKILTVLILLSKKLPSCHSGMRRKTRRLLGFSLLINLLGKSGTPCISLFEEVLTSEIWMGNTSRNLLSLYWNGSSLSWNSSGVLWEWDWC